MGNPHLLGFVSLLFLVSFRFLVSFAAFALITGFVAIVTGLGFSIICVVVAGLSYLARAGDARS